MKNKYSMPQDRNILLAKRLLVDAVYKSANLEGIAVTYANTVDILNDVNVDNVKPSEIGKVFCLRDAWHFLLDHVNDPVDLGFLQSLHEIIAKSEVGYRELGKFRAGDVLISGTSWRPEIPDSEKLHFELQDILKIENPTDRAITAMLWIMRTQMFIDGNKRVATMIGNKILIQNGNGILSVPVELDGVFKTMLAKYYETNDVDSIKEWVYEHCIEGVNCGLQEQPEKAETVTDCISEEQKDELEI